MHSEFQSPKSAAEPSTPSEESSAKGTSSSTLATSQSQSMRKPPSAIVISQLPPIFGKSKLRQLCARFGNVLAVKVNRLSSKEASGYVLFEDPESAREAIFALNGNPLPEGYLSRSGSGSASGSKLLVGYTKKGDPFDNSDTNPQSSSYRPRVPGYFASVPATNQSPIPVINPLQVSTNPMSIRPKATSVEGPALAYPYVPLLVARAKEYHLGASSGHYNTGSRSNLSSIKEAKDSPTAPAPSVLPDEAPSILPHDCDDVDDFCAKGRGFWAGLSYKQPHARKEFMRFSHRTLEGAAAMLITSITGLIYTPNYTAYEPWQVWGVLVCLIALSVLLVVELVLHLWKKGGRHFTYKVATQRQIVHSLVAVCWTSWDIAIYARLYAIECGDDFLYEMVHGKQASAKEKYLSCVRSFVAGDFVIFFVLTMLELDVRVHWAMTTLGVIGHAVVVATTPLSERPAAGLVWDDKPNDHIFRVLIVFLAAQVSNLMVYAKRRIQQRQFEAAIRAHHQTHLTAHRLQMVDSLLCSMMPPCALQRLAAGQQVILDRSEQASVLFADMVNFTRWSSCRSPHSVVEMFNTLVRSFDTLAATMSVAKVKTIGDCYWAVSGIPDRNPYHAEMLVRFALEMVSKIKAEVKENGRHWRFPPAPTQVLNDEFSTEVIEFRVGIHSGSVTGGVQGRQQISYEVFGETSDTANWIEQHAPPMHVTVSPQTRELLLPREAFTVVNHPVTVVDAPPELLRYSTRQQPQSPQKEGVSTGSESSTTMGSTSASSDINSISVATRSSTATTRGEKQKSLIPLYLVAGASAVSDSKWNQLRTAMAASTENSTATETRYRQRQLITSQLAALQGRAEDQLEEQKNSSDTGRQNESTADSLVGAGDGPAGQTGSLLFSHQTLAELTAQYAEPRYNCLFFNSFKDEALEAEYRAFAIKELIFLRVGGTITWVALAYILFFVIYLADAAPRSACIADTLLFTTGISCLAMAVLFAVGRWNKIRVDGALTELAQEEARLLDVGGPAISFLGTLFCCLAAFWTADSIVTNVTGYLSSLVIFPLTMPYLHWPTGRLMIATFACLFLPVMVQGMFFSQYPIDAVRVIILCGLWLLFLLIIYEKRLRAQFVDQKATAHFVAQQRLAIQAQEAVLGSIVPDFIIEPLMLWLSKGFDPQVTVCRSFKTVGIAFLQLHASEDRGLFSAGTDNNAVSRRSSNGGRLPSRHSSLSSPATTRDAPAGPGHRGSGSDVGTTTGFLDFAAPPTEDQPKEFVVLDLPASSGGTDPGGTGGTPAAAASGNGASRGSEPSYSSGTGAALGLGDTVEDLALSVSELSSSMEGIERWGEEAEHRVEWLFRGHEIVDTILSRTAVLDKVKTVGDVVIIAGSFRGHSIHEAVQTLVSTVVEIQQRLSQDATTAESGITVGLHAGPVMAVVSGYSRLAFDIFGDAVNTASRVMASPVAKRRIAASANFIELLSAARQDPTDIADDTLIARRIMSPPPIFGGVPGHVPTRPRMMVNSMPQYDFGPVCSVNTKGKGEMQLRQLTIAGTGTVTRHGSGMGSMRYGEGGNGSAPNGGNSPKTSMYRGSPSGGSPSSLNNRKPATASSGDVVRTSQM